MIDQLIQTICSSAIPMILAITLHEVAHGYAAYRFGDKTAYYLGRLTINPIPHIAPVGTIAVPGVLFALSALTGSAVPIFGWAKPVPVNSMNFRGNWRNKMAAVSIAGPLSNLLQAIFWALFLKVLLFVGIHEPFFFEMVKAGIVINLMLMAFNLIPLPPLDGGMLVLNILPPSLAKEYGRLLPYGQWILLILIFTGLFKYLVYPLFSFGQWVITTLVL